MRNGYERSLSSVCYPDKEEILWVRLVESGVVELLVFYDFEMPNRFGIFVISAVRRLAMVIGQIE